MKTNQYIVFASTQYVIEFRQYLKDSKVNTTQYNVNYNVATL